MTGQILSPVKSAYTYAETLSMNIVLSSADDQRACGGSDNGRNDGSERGRLSPAPVQCAAVSQRRTVRARRRRLQVPLPHRIR